MVQEIFIGDAFGEDGYIASRLVDADTSTPSSSLPLFGYQALEGDVRAGVWRAAPGLYRHPGGGAEVFVVIEGSATLHVDGDDYVLRPGTVAAIPADTPSEMHVTAELRKVSLVADQ